MTSYFLEPGPENDHIRNNLACSRLSWDRGGQLGAGNGDDYIVRDNLACSTGTEGTSPVNGTMILIYHIREMFKAV